MIPVVNIDGFNLSREAGEAQGAGGGRNGDEQANVSSYPFEYRRKNCRLADGSPSGNCVQPVSGLDEAGVDLGRNYGAFWGGPGADMNPLTQNYRGPGPVSEPETRNIRELISKRQVTTLITNHSLSNHVLRPPGAQRFAPTPDEAIYQALGEELAARNGYLSARRSQVYDATGTLEDWTYYSTGALAFLFAIGPSHFHPPFAEVVAEYEGTTSVTGVGGGNREAYFTALENTADAAKHSVLAGQAPSGAVLRLRKTFQTPTWPLADGNPILLNETLDTTMRVSSGTFEWHINQSTRPLVSQPRGRPSSGTASDPEIFDGGMTGQGDGALACGDTNSEATACFNDHAFTVPGGAGVDNGIARVRVQWADHVNDWDLKVFRDSNGDGSSVGETQLLGTSAQRFSSSEETDIAEPALQPGGQYVIRVLNFDATASYDGTISFAGPDPPRPALTESWALTCEVPEGTVRSQHAITIARGERQTLALCGTDLIFADGFQVGSLAIR